MRALAISLVLALGQALAGCSTKYVAIAVTSTPSGADVRLGPEARIVARTPSEPIVVDVPASDPTVIITVTKLDHTVGRNIVRMGRVHDSPEEARADVQRFDFQLSPR